MDETKGRCFTCGFNANASSQYRLPSSRPFPLGMLIIIASVLGALIGLGLVWAVYGNDVHTGYAIILGSLVNAINNPDLVNSEITDSAQLTRFFLICFLIINLLILVLTLISWQRHKITTSSILLLLFLVLDIFFLVLINSIPAATAPGMLLLVGKGYHICVFSLFFGTMGALANLFFPNLPTEQ